MTNSRKIKIAGILSYASIIFSILSTLLYTPWMLNKIGKSNYGLYTIALSLINIFLFDFGLSKAAHKMLSEANVKEEDTNNIVGTIYRIYLYISLLLSLIFLVVYFLLPSIYNNFTSQELSTFKMLFIITSIYSVVSFLFIPQNGILQSYEKYIELKSLDFLNKIITVTLIVIALLLNYNVVSIIIGTAISGLLIILLKQYIIRFKMKIKPNYTYKSKEINKELINTSLWSSLIPFSQRFIFTVTPIILGRLTSPEDVALFGIVSSIEGNIYTLGAALNGLFLTKNTRDIFNNDMVSLEKDILWLQKFIYFLMFLIVTGFIVLGKKFIFLWLGEHNDLIYWGTILIIVPTALYLPKQIPNNILLINNKVKYQGLVYVFMGLINIGLMFLFVHFFGILGSLISIMTAYLFRNVSMAVIHQKNVDIDWLKYNINMIKNILLVLFIVFVFKFVYISNNNLYLEFVINGVILTIVFVLLYIPVNRMKIFNRNKT